MTDKFVQHTPRGPLRAIYEWLTGAASVPAPDGETARTQEATDYLTAWLDGRPADMSMFSFSALKIQDDPEAIFQEGWLLCDVGAHEGGLDHLRRAVAKGYFVAPTLSGRRQFDGLRSEPAFQALLAAAESGRQRALAAFRAAGGERLLGG